MYVDHDSSLCFSFATQSSMFVPAAGFLANILCFGRRIAVGRSRLVVTWGLGQ